MYFVSIAITIYFQISFIQRLPMLNSFKILDIFSKRYMIHFNQKCNTLLQDSCKKN